MLPLTFESGIFRFQTQHSVAELQSHLCSCSWVKKNTEVLRKDNPFASFWDEMKTSPYVGWWKKWNSFQILIQRKFVEAVLQALWSQLWSIQWTLCWLSDPQVRDRWMREEQVNDKCISSETQVTLECPRWNASVSQVPAKGGLPISKSDHYLAGYFSVPASLCWGYCAEPRWCYFELIV